MIKIEIDLRSLHKAQVEGKTGRPGLVKKKVTVKRGGKTFQQYRWVKADDEPKEPKVEEKPIPTKPKEPVIMGLNKPSESNETEIVPIDQAKKEMGSHIGDLHKTSEGKQSLDRVESYTGGDYKSINQYLRTGKMAFRDLRGKISVIKPPKRKKDQQDEEIKKISDFIGSAPKVEGTVYRGMMWRKDKKSTKEFNEFIDEMIVGSDVEFPTFSSTSTDESTAIEFATLASKKEPIHSIVIKMQSKSGVYLNGASAFAVENEVLFDRDSKFIVTKIDKNSDPIRISLSEA
jgi:hypothetical protein